VRRGRDSHRWVCQRVTLSAYPNKIEKYSTIWISYWDLTDKAKIRTQPYGVSAWREVVGLVSSKAARIAGNIIGP
jgi:hypothetical protein